MTQTGLPGAGAIDSYMGDRSLGWPGLRLALAGVDQGREVGGHVIGIRIDLAGDRAPLRLNLLGGFTTCSTSGPSKWFSC